MARIRRQRPTPRTPKNKETSRDVTQPTATSRNSSPRSTMGRKRQQPSKQASSAGKRQKTQSLTTDDIPEIVSAVVEALPQPGPGGKPPSSRGNKGTSRSASQRTHSKETRPGQSLHRQDRCNWEASPDNAECEESSDKDLDNEDFGKNHCLCCSHLEIIV